MRQAVFGFLFVCAVNAVAVVGADAAIITLSPDNTAPSVGNSLQVDVGISGLGNGAAPSLGAFLVELVFDDTLSTFDSAVYGPFLGDTDPLSFETDIFTTSGPGFVSLDEFSFLFDFELDALQADAFTLATVSFDVIDAGSSFIDFGFVDLSTADGQVLIPDELIGATIDAQPSAAVPLHNTLILLCSGFCLLISRLRAARLSAI
jgi:hypothetical protein